MKIFIGADHRGFKLKEVLKTWLGEQGYSIHDCGNTIYDPDDDFPVYAFAVAKNVSEEQASRGIVICGSGVGVNIAANKVIGIRASTAINIDEVRHARAHDDLNVLALSSDYITIDEAQNFIKVYLETPYVANERFKRRLQQISEYEERKR